MADTRSKAPETPPARRVVELFPPDPMWPHRFAEEARRLSEALGGVAVRIEHVGSTAVPGLAAKPVIDIQLSVRSLEPADPYREPLERLGYEHRPDDEPAHRFFKRDVNGVRAFHVHVCEAGGGWERRHLAFRDHLRASPDDAARYEAEKRRLAARFREDVDAYADAKTPFVRSVERAIRALEEIGG